jgi:hypothetical protein
MLVERIDTECQAVTRITWTPVAGPFLDEAITAGNSTDTALLWRPRTAPGTQEGRSDDPLAFYVTGP